MLKRSLPKLITTFAITSTLLTSMAASGLSTVSAASNINDSFTKASEEFSVPVELLKTICYFEGRLSNHGGSPSIDNGFSCMHLTKNKNADTLDQAAKDLNVSTDKLKNDMPTSIRGGAAVLRDLEIKVSPNHVVSPNLSDWYGAVASYSGAATKASELTYADAVFKTMQQGFSAQDDNGTTVTQSALKLTPNTQTAAPIPDVSNTLPAGCVNDGKTDYPGAIDCMPDPKTFDCNFEIGNAGCNYYGDQRPSLFNIDEIVIHDIEGTIQDALNIFQDPNNFVSVHYLVDTDGTVYQFIPESGVAFHAGNRYYNNHSVGIEHAGFDATGFQWYNASEYLGSAKLTAYLTKKYNIPTNHDQIVSHGTIPAPFLAAAPNHVDPGPYWLWDYYLAKVHQQGISIPKISINPNIISLHPLTDFLPLGNGGTETPSNFNFFYSYNGPSTASGLIPQEGTGSDVTDVTDNVEPDTSYYVLDKTIDPAGSGKIMYKIWYGEEDQAHDLVNPTLFAHAKTAWLAVPPGAALPGVGTPVSVSGANNSTAEIYGRPTTSSAYIIGDAPSGAKFVSARTVTEDGTTNKWYEINYNHRQAWVPSNEVTVTAK